MLQLLLSAAVPFQRLLDQASPTHGFINRQAVAILGADGHGRAAALLSRHLSEFNRGSDWADGDWRNVGHMYDPATGRGFRGWPSAVETVREHWEAARGQFRAGRLGQAFFWLGAAAHLVQDLCVPHHAAARLFAGHKRFEGFARRYRHRYAVHAGGIYGAAGTPEGWVELNAATTRSHFSHCVTENLSRAQIDSAVRVLLPRAQRTTAGFVHHFLQVSGDS